MFLNGRFYTNLETELSNCTNALYWHIRKKYQPRADYSSQLNDGSYID